MAGGVFVKQRAVEQNAALVDGAGGRHQRNLDVYKRQAVGRSRRSIAALMDIRPDHANLVGPDGTARQVAPAEVQVGDVILVKPGERVPLDGTCLLYTSRCV